jgi:predicted small integral membrane protein
MAQDWLFENIGSTWMQWTGITAVFFGCVFVMLLCMTIAQLVYPTRERRGFLPLVTARGDRLFIGLLSSAYIHLLWLGVFPAGWPLWIATIISFVWVVIVIGLG